MLTVEENTLISRTGPGSPMGELFRRFWVPAFLSSELDAPDGAPLRTRLLGEDLVAFRDTNGQVGLVEAFCPHRRAPLFFARNEECGLRCVYHGWKFDVSGACIDMPSEPPESNFKDKVRVKAYPTYETGGLVWAYMGPLEKQPSRPPFIEWTELPAARVRVSKWFHECNYLQGIEGDIDTAHIGFLHRDTRPRPGPGVWQTQSARDNELRRKADRFPRLTVMETDYGLVYGGRRATEDGLYYWRLTQWMLPGFSLIPAPVSARGGTAWIPVDDSHCVRYNIGLNPDADFDATALGGGMTSSPTQFTLPDGTVIDTMLPPGTKANTYGLDRAAQRAGSFSGIEGIPMQDKAMIEGMGYLCDRSQEHLGTTDLAVIAMRRLFLRLARELQQGIEPVAPSKPELYRVRPLDILSPEAELEGVLREHGSKTRVPA
ncbi:MAG: Rieske 2Fe-2S domain-containing protein [Chloroflexota bacterium]